MHKLTDSENQRNVNRGQSIDFEEVFWVKEGLTIALVVILSVGYQRKLEARNP